MSDRQRCSFCGEETHSPTERIEVTVRRYNELNGRTNDEIHWICWDCIPTWVPGYTVELAYSNTQQRVTGGSIEHEGEYPYVRYIPPEEFGPHLIAIGMIIQSVIRNGVYHYGQPVDSTGMIQATIDSIEHITGEEYEVQE